MSLNNGGLGVFYFFHFYKFQCMLAKIFERVDLSKVIFPAVMYNFYKQIESCPSPQTCLYFKDFQGSKLLIDCVVVSPNKQILISLFH